MFQRCISSQDVFNTLKNHVIIETYNDDYPYPSFLLYNNSIKTPLHLVIGINEKDIEIFIITVYIPNEKVFTNNFTERLVK